MDRQQIWADRLPPCYGICPAGMESWWPARRISFFWPIATATAGPRCARPLFTGFAAAALERGINCPQWGLDDWIYFGRGHGGGKITGPHLKQAVDLPNTDFRIRADGSAIEPITGGTHTIGFAFTERGDRLVISTGTPGMQVAPLPWNYLAAPIATWPVRPLEANAAADRRAYPASKPHPWRTRRAEIPAFPNTMPTNTAWPSRQPNGYFTSACSPLVYQGAIARSLRGQLLACEPAQNFIYRGMIHRDGTATAAGAPGGRGEDGVSRLDRRLVSPDGACAGSGRQHLCRRFLSRDHRRLFGHSALFAAAIRTESRPGPGPHVAADSARVRRPAGQPT